MKTITSLSCVEEFTASIHIIGDFYVVFSWQEFSQDANITDKCGLPGLQFIFKADEPISVEMIYNLVDKYSIELKMIPTNNTELLAFVTLFSRLFVSSVTRSRSISPTTESMKKHIEYLRIAYDALSIYFYAFNEEGQYELSIYSDTTNFESKPNKQILKHLASGALFGRYYSESFIYTSAKTVLGNEKFIFVSVCNKCVSSIGSLSNSFHSFFSLFYTIWYKSYCQYKDIVTLTNFESLLQKTQVYKYFEIIDKPILFSKKLEMDKLSEEEPLIKELLSNLSEENQKKLENMLNMLDLKQKFFDRAVFPHVNGKTWVSIRMNRYPPDFSGGNDIISFLIEDLSYFYSLEKFSKKSSADLNLCKSLLCLYEFHQQNDNSIIIEEKSFFDELGFPEHPLKINDLFHQDDILSFKNLKHKKTTNVRLKNSKNEYIWYSFVCTKDKPFKGFLFSVNEQRSLYKKIHATQSCIACDKNSYLFSAFIIHNQPIKSDYDYFPSWSLQSYLERIYNEDQDTFNKFVVDSMSTRKDSTIEVRISHKHGSFEWYSFVIMPIKDQCAFCLAFNIHEKKVALDMLHKTEQLLDLALSYTKVRMWIFYDNNDQDLVNTYEFKTNRSIQMNWMTIKHNIPLEYQNTMNDVFRRAIDNKSSIDIEVPVIFEKTYWVLIRGVYINESNTLVGVFINTNEMHEATEEIEKERKKSEEALQAKSQFLNSITQEIKKPLISIRGLLDVFQSFSLTTEQIELTNCVQSSLADLSELVDDTIDLGSFESGRFEFKKEIFCLSVELSKAICPYYQRIDKSRVQFRIRFSPGLPLKFLGHPYCFRRVIESILSNCLKFTQNGYIELRIEEIEKGIVIVFSNTGPGITDTTVKGIEKYFENPNTLLLGENQGVGVGLSLVAKILSQISGKFTISPNEKVTQVSVFFKMKPIFVPFLPKSVLQSYVFLYTNNGWFKSLITSHAEFCGYRMFVVEKIESLSELVLCSACIIDGSDIDDVFSLRLPQQTPIFFFSDKNINNSNGFINVFPNPPVPLYIYEIFWNLKYKKAPQSHKNFNVGCSLTNNLNLDVMVVEPNLTEQIVMKSLLEKIGCHVEVVSESITISKNIDAVFVDSKFGDISNIVTQAKQNGSMIIIIGEDTQTYEVDNYISRPLSIYGLLKVLMKC